ncbi:MAG: hypothetical protein M3Y27_04825, partial [Acidobacteriota bacterium]|nr:hypothetical protein [Acidobacteriota bacterium]
GLDQLLRTLEFESGIFKLRVSLAHGGGGSRRMIFIAKVETELGESLGESAASALILKLIFLFVQLSDDGAFPNGLSEIGVDGGDAAGYLKADIDGFVGVERSGDRNGFVDPPGFGLR